MVKRLIIILLALLPSTIATMAQSVVGGWERYSAFSGGITRLIDTPSHVYYVSNGYLFDYDKENDTTTSHNSSTTLSDNSIILMQYNRDARYLFIGYSNGNIDLLYDDGRVVNIPDIKDASMSVEKIINNVWFDEDRTYVSMSFGIVVLDGKRHYVIDSADYGKAINAAFTVGDVLLLETGNQVLGIEKGKSIRSLDNFKTVVGTPVRSVVSLGDDRVAILSTYDMVAYRLTDPLAGKYNVLWRQAGYKSAQPYITTADDKVYFTCNNHIYNIDKESGSVTDVKTLPSTLNNMLISFDRGISSVWAGGNNGTGNFDISGATPTVLSDFGVPAGSSTVAEALQLYQGPSNKIYVSNRGQGTIRPHNSAGNGRNVRQFVDIITDGNFTNGAATSGTKEYNKCLLSDGKGGYYPGSPENIVEDPDDPSIYYQASAAEGVFVIKDNEIIGQFHPGNSPITEPYGALAFNIKIDPDGNLWVVCDHMNNSSYPSNTLVMLPAAKRRQDPKTITKADWKVYPFTARLFFDAFALLCENSNYIFLMDGAYQSGMAIIDTKGTWDDFSDDVQYWANTFTDQDGSTVQPEYCLFATEDKRGRVWIGTSMGVFEVTNPKTITNNNIQLTRIKVPRNDGSNYADYLLGSDRVYSIAVDNSNRKWIATAESGLFLVSENGDKIIENFTTENSPLPSNEIASVVADRTSNKVYVGTRMGLLSYNSTSSPVADNFDNVYAYPNPVRPDYTGWITIAGLMDNSLVKIADAQGNVVYQTTSEGGMAIWDGCTLSGSRVKTGVYYVFASAGGTDGTSSTGAVTKILVVN